MDIFETIQGRKSIRRFKQAPVPDEDLNKILDAGRWAPSANNTQPWSFIVIKDRAMLKAMATAVREMIDRMIPFAESEKQAQRLAAYKSNYYTFFENAPVVIAVCMEAYDAGTDRLLAKMGYSTEDIKRLRPLPGLQSVSAAVQNMLLASPCTWLWLLLDDRPAGGSGGVRENIRFRERKVYRRPPAGGRAG